MALRYASPAKKHQPDLLGNGGIYDLIQCFQKIIGVIGKTGLRVEASAGIGIDVCICEMEYFNAHSQYPSS